MFLQTEEPDSFVFGKWPSFLIEQRNAVLSRRCSTKQSQNILGEKLPAFERVLWRACRRTAFLRSAEIEEPLDNPDKPVRYKPSNIMNGQRCRGKRLKSLSSSYSTMARGLRPSSIKSAKASKPNNITNVQNWVKIVSCPDNILTLPSLLDFRPAKFGEGPKKRRRHANRHEPNQGTQIEGFECSCP